MYRPYPPPTTPPRRPLWPWILVGVTFSIVIVLILYLVLFAPVPSGGGRPFFGYYGGGFLLIFFLILIGFFGLRMALWASIGPRYRRYGGGPGGGRGAYRDPAVMEARQRYARGEITREQYDQILKDLGRPPLPP